MNKQIEVKVKPFVEGMGYYAIYYRDKWRYFNFLNFWTRLNTVLRMGARLSKDQPILFTNFDEAVNYANTLKENPLLIDEQINLNKHLIKEESKKADEIRKKINRTKVI